MITYLQRRTAERTSGSLMSPLPTLVTRAAQAAVLAAAVLVMAGCGSGTLPTTVPSGTLPPLPTREAPTATATVTVTKAASTVTVTDKSTVTTTRKSTETETVTRSATETETRTTTAQPSPTCQGSDCPAVPASDQGVPWFWPALLLAAAVAAGVVAWRIVRGRQEWDRRYQSTRTELEWVEGALIPRVLSAPSAEAAATQWEAGRGRVLLAAEELRSLTSSAPAQPRADKARALSQSLAELIGALDADAALSPSADADTVRAAVVGVESSRRALRSALDSDTAGR